MQSIFDFNIKNRVPRQIKLESHQSKILVGKMNFKGVFQDCARIIDPHFLVLAALMANDPPYTHTHTPYI